MRTGGDNQRDDVIPADLQAQIVHLASEIGCAGPILMCMWFSTHLDPARLSRAARLLLDAEPILGCWFDTAPRQPVWRRRDDLDQMEWCVIHPEQDPDDLARALLTPIPEHLHQTFRLHLLPRAGGDVLMMWISHLLADSFAAAECASLLADIYSRLAGDAGYRPEPNPAPRENEPWMTEISWQDTLSIIRRDAIDAFQCRGPVHGFRRSYDAFQEAKPVTAEFVRYRISPEHIAVLDRMAAERRCTRNDLLTTGLLRAFADFAYQGPNAKAQVGLTVNLRTYAPARDRPATCSMVGLSRICVGPDLDSTFDDTLAQVTAVLRRQKKALMGAANPLMIRVLNAMSFAFKRAMVVRMIRRDMRQAMAPTFSNAGRISAARLHFDAASPDDVVFLVFPVALPLFLVGAVEYRGAVTLTTCFQPADLSPDRVRQFLERIVNEIPCNTGASMAEAA
jgi:NRPS condensation-like uncharacterized protein